VKRKSNSSILVALSRRSNHQITHEGETTHGLWVRVYDFIKACR
jgi:hypothetical protein